jgi:shikimate kinase
VNIILLGFHGSGKTVVGKLLADQLWSTLVDVDETLAAQIAGQGEGPADYLPAVTAGQAKLLEALKEGGQVVFAASSVAVPDGQTVPGLKAHSKLVYLRAQPPVLAQRIAEDPARRGKVYPLFRRAETADVAAALAKRDSLWAGMADVTLDTDPMTPQTVARLVIRMAM